MATSKRLEISEGGDTAVVRFLDRHIADILDIEKVGEELYSLVEKGKHRRLILDFSDVHYLSSALIGKLISLNSRVRARKGSVKLCSIRPDVYEVFRTCELDRIFFINKDVADASPSF
jgi:anti-sigma B factor antagonist